MKSKRSFCVHIGACDRAEQYVTNGHRSVCMLYLNQASIWIRHVADIPRRSRGRVASSWRGRRLPYRVRRPTSRCAEKEQLVDAFWTLDVHQEIGHSLSPHRFFAWCARQQVAGTSTARTQYSSKRAGQAGSANRHPGLRKWFRPRSQAESFVRGNRGCLVMHCLCHDLTP